MVTEVLRASSSSSKHDLISDALINAKNVVCLTGAGISTSAGIPDFRSKDGLYNMVNSHIEKTLARRGKGSGAATSPKQLKALQTMQGKDLFSANVFRDPEQAAVFYSFISSLYASSLGTDVQPTKTHKFIAKLASKKKLVRCYTQNIDCLEERAGLISVLDKKKNASSSKGKGKQTFEGEVVQLHGRIDRLKCGCGYEGDWSDEVLDQFAVGEAAPCPECDQRAADRARRSKRTIRSVGHFGTLKPAILLYDDPSPPSTAETILEIEQYDLDRKVDLVLVMGTSLKVPGFKLLVKDFITEARTHASTSKSKTKVCAILVNETNVLTSEWSNIFDYHVMDKCDEFVDRVTKRWKSRKPDDWLQQNILSNLSNTRTVKSASSSKAKASTSKNKGRQNDEEDEEVASQLFSAPARCSTPPPLKKEASIISIPSSPVRPAGKRKPGSEQQTYIMIDSSPVAPPKRKRMKCPEPSPEL